MSSYRYAEPDSQYKTLAELALRVWSAELETSMRGLRFVEPSPPPGDFSIRHDAVTGFVKSGKIIYIRTGLTMRELVATVLHEVDHSKWLLKRGETNWTMAERNALLAEFEYLGDLSARAGYDETKLFLEQLDKQRVQELREKFTPVLKQMAENYAAKLRKGGLKIPGVLIEYR